MVDNNGIDSTCKVTANNSDGLKRRLDGKENEGPATKRLKKSKEEKEIEKRQKELQKEKERQTRLDLEAAKKREREAEKQQREQQREQQKEQERIKRLEQEAVKKQEREIRRQQKEEERRLKEEKKEEEKRLKDQKREEERRLREQKKEQEKLLRDQEKRLKEEKKEQERQRKEEEKQKESRQQKSIASFFSIKPKSFKPLATCKPTESQQKSDYQRYFLPFHLKANTEWISSVKDPIHIEQVVKEMDNNSNTEDMIDWLARQRHSRHCCKDSSHHFKTSDIVNALNQGLLDEAIGIKRLKSIPFKHLQFAENIRPPYIGTFSKPCVEKLALDPWVEIVPDVRYDYDSEMEWVQADDEEDDGEDIGDEDSEDGLDEDDKEMEEFLDMDDDAPRRQQIIGELQPLILWNNDNGSDDDDHAIFNKMQLEYLFDVEDSIDPFKDYWKSDSPVKQTVKSNVLQLSQKPDCSPSNKKLVPSELIKAVLDKVQGSDMNQILLIEVLKKEFPTVSKEAIRNTIKLYAKRVGDKETDKRWEINQDACKSFNLTIRAV